MTYGRFAEVYDRLMADVDYAGWAAYCLSLFEAQGITVRRAADCACGTGSMTLALAVRGVNMTGLDLSADMLRVADGKARARGLRVPFIRQDMRRLALHRPVDAVFCACDGVNYLTRPEDVMAFFRAAHGAIRAGGGLLFDVSTPYKLANVLGDNCLGNDDRAVAYLWQNHYSQADRRVQMDLAFFVREPDGRYVRFDETHWQRAHAGEELRRWLLDAGFERVYIYGDRSSGPPGPREERMHVLAIRS